MAMSDEDFSTMSCMLAESDRQALRQARFLAKESLGELSSIRTIKAAQVQADAKAKQLQAAQEVLAKRKVAAMAALTAVREQEKKVEVLRRDLEQAVARAKSVLAAGEGEATPGADAGSAAATYAGLAAAAASAMAGAELGDAAGPIKALLERIVADSKATSPPPPASPPPQQAAGAGQEGLAGDGEGSGSKKEDETMEGEGAPADEWKALFEEYCAGDLEKRKWADDFAQWASQAGAAKRQRQG